MIHHNKVLEMLEEEIEKYKKDIGAKNGLNGMLEEIFTDAYYIELCRQRDALVEMLKKQKSKE